MVFNMSDHPFGLKIEVVDCYMTKSQCRYKQASIWCVVDHRPYALTLNHAGGGIRSDHF